MRSAVLLLSTLCCTTAIAQEALEYTDSFPIENCTFVPSQGNDYFSLRTGSQSYFSNAACVAAGDCDELEEVRITVLGDTERIPYPDDEGKPIVARVIEEYETVDGELAEISRNYFATCRESNDVYYFGEQVDIYEDGVIVSHAGEWLAGVLGAEPGLIMPQSAFIIGQREYQEIAPGVALDRAVHVDSGFDIVVPAGLFDECVEVSENTPLEPDSESTKIYCKGVGLVADEELEATVIYAK
jgi:hypothetical protein